MSSALSTGTTSTKSGDDSLHGFRFLKLNNRNKDNFGVEFTQNTLLFLAKIVNSK